MTAVITRVSGKRDQMKVGLIRMWRSNQRADQKANQIPIEIITPKNSPRLVIHELF